MISPQLLEQLVAAVADELAPRVASAVAAELSPAQAREPWRLYDLGEAAALLGRSERWVRERVKRGDLPFVRLDGGALAFELDDVRAFAAARRVAGSVLADRLQQVREASAGAGSRGGHQPPELRVSHR